MKKLIIITMLSILVFSSASADSLVDYYYSKIEPLEFSNSVNFQQIDHQIDPEYANGSLYYPGTIGKSIWLGSLPLIKGELVSSEGIFDYANLNGTMMVTINKLTASSVNISVYAVSYVGGGWFSTTGWVTLINKEVSEGDVISGNFSKRIGSFAEKYGSDSYLIDLSYLNFLKYDIESVYMSAIVVKLTMSGNNSWAHEAEVSVVVNTEHNPSFYELMMERSNSIYNSELISDITSDVSEAYISSNTTSTPFSHNLLSIAIITTLFIYSKKLRIVSNSKFRSF